MTGPTDDQAHDLLEQLIDLQSAAVDRQRAGEIEPALVRAFETSNHYALIYQASYAAARFLLAEQLLRRVHGDDAALNFPRAALLDNAPARLSPDVHAKCVTLVELIVSEDQTDAAQDLVLWLAEHVGVNALADLYALTVMLGRMVVDTTSDFESLSDLIAQEGVDTILEWIVSREQD